MLENFLLAIIVFFIGAGIGWFVYILYAMWRFVSESVAVTKLYNQCKNGNISLDIIQEALII